MIDRVWSFSGGRVRHLQRLVRADGSWTMCTLPARYAIIEHSDGPIVFDTGYHPSLRRRLKGAARLYNRVVPWRCDPEEAVGARLQQLGFTATDVQLVVLSHMHADHIAGLVDLPDRPIALTRTAWDHLQTGGRLERGRHGYFPELMPRELPSATRWLPEPPPGDSLDHSAADLLGDGSVGVVALPGHAPGQVGLILRPSRGPRILLAADATFSRGAVDLGVGPSEAFVRAVFHDSVATHQTIRRLRNWHLAEPDLHLHCAHGWEGPADGLITPA